MRSLQSRQILSKCKSIQSHGPRLTVTPENSFELRRQKFSEQQLHFGKFETSEKKTISQATSSAYNWYLLVSSRVQDTCCSDMTDIDFACSYQWHTRQTRGTRRQAPCEWFAWRNPCSLHSYKATTYTL